MTRSRLLFPFLFLSVAASSPASAAAATLQVTGLSASPTQLVPGGTLSVTDSVRVDGALPAGFWVAWYASTDTTITTSDVYLGHRWVAPTGQTTFTSNATSSVVLPPGVTGTYRLGAIADPESAVSTAGTAKTRVGPTLSIEKPDVTIDTVTFSPSSIVAGGTITVTTKVTAVRGAVGGFSVRIYASTDATITKADTFLGLRRLDGLAANASSQATTTVTLPPFLAGNLRIGAIVDADGNVEESDETNNTRTGATLNVALPDLTVSSVTATPTSPRAGGELSIASSVTTNGSVGGFWVRFYASTDSSITTADALIGGRWVSSLAAGQTSTATTVVTLPPTLTGSRRVGAIVDADNGVVESNERNNGLVGTTINVAIPDLVQQSVSVAESSVGALGSVTVTDSVAATGAAAGGFWVRFYATTDATGADAGTLLGGRWVSGLAAGETSTATTAVTMEAITTGGAWYIKAVADADDGIPESSEWNNAAVTPGRVEVLRPDLVVTALSAVETQVRAGGTFTVEDRVEALVGGTRGFWVRFYASADTTITRSDLCIGGRWVSGLRAGESSQGVTTLSYPGGSFHLGAIVDADHGIAESDEDNNTAVGPLITHAVPDLTVVRAWAQHEVVAAGGTLEINAIIHAEHEGSGPFDVRYFLSPDPLITADDLPIGAWRVGWLGADFTAGTMTPVPAPLAPGTYWLGAWIDGGGEVAESDEANNFALGGQVVILPADLVAGALTVSQTSVAPGGQLEVETRVTAEGGATGGFWVRLYASEDPNVTNSDVPLGGRWVSALASGAASVGVTTVSVPASVTGSFYVGAIVDADGGVPEDDEANNVAVGGLVTLLRPDLRATRITFAPATITAGGQIAITDAVTVTTVPSGRFRVAYYASSDPVITAADVRVGERTIEGLAVGASDTATTTLTLPPALSGPYHVGALVDAGNEVAESDETNNAIAGDVVRISRPDLVAGPVALDRTALEQGDTLRVTTSATAQGVVTSVFQVAIYLSRDEVMGADDVFLGSRSVTSMASGETWTAATPLVLPGALYGPWRVLAVVDSGGEVGESDETNNVTVGGTITIGRPDLQAGALAVTPASLGAGGTITVQDAVTAVNGAVPSFAVHFYASRDTVITPDDTFLGVRTVPALAADAESRGTTALALPVELAGTWYVGAIVDAGQAVDEENEANNAVASVAIEIAKPDLVPGPVAVSPATVEAGATFTVTEAVQARGGGSGPFQIRCYLSQDAAITAADTLLGSRTIAGLAAGVSSEATATYTMPASLTGTWYVGVVVDPEEAVSEADEANNAATAQLAVSRPNLTVVSVAAAPSSLGAGGTLDVTDTVRAAGSATGAFTVGIYLSSDPAVTQGDVRLGERQVASLAVGVTSSGTTRVQLPVGLSGTWYVGAVADDRGTVQETNEEDNAGAGGAITIARPDLVVDAFSIGTASVGAGGTLTVTDRVSAHGGAAAEFTVRYYLSADATITVDDLLLGTRVATGLAEGSSSQGSTVLMVPVALVGTYHLGALVDADGVVAESDESNNVGGPAALQLVRPDLHLASLEVAQVVVAPGSALQVSDAVVSAGGGAGPFSVSYSLVRTSGSGTPIALGTRAVSGLAAGATSAVTTSLPLPAGASGLYRLLAAVDPANAVTESNEANNVFTGPIIQVGYDTEGPSITVSGVTDGLVTRDAPITVCVMVEDENLEGFEATLDGDDEFDTCATAFALGDHELVVRARDTFGNESEAVIAFAIDQTPPVITLAGVDDGALLNVGAVTPTFTVVESHPGTVTALLGTHPFVSGTPVTAEGDHVLTVTAVDAAGNTAFAERSFGIDRTAPVVHFSGVADGAVLGAGIAPGISVEDAHPDTLTVTLGGKPYEPGTTIEAPGTHTLVATAVDAVGLTGSGQVTFTIDVTGPTVAISAPSEGWVTSAESVEVLATVTDPHGIGSVQVNDVTIPAPGGQVATTVALAEGTNTIEVAARDLANNPGSASVTVRRDTTPPAITLSSPAEGATTAGTLEVSGSVEDASAVTVTVNGDGVDLTPQGTFTTTLTLGDGAHTVTVVATDVAGNHDEVIRNVQVDSAPPTLVVSEPPSGFVTTHAQVTVRGTAKASGGTPAVTVAVGDATQTVTPGAGGAFSASVKVADGSVSIRVVVTDGQGRTAEQTIQGTYDDGADPGGEAGSLVLLVDAPEDRSVIGSGAMAASGRVSGGTPPYTITVSGAKAAVSSGYFSAGLNLAEGEHTLIVRATDAAGHAVQTERRVSVDRTAPYLVVSRPASPAGEATESPYLVEGDVGDVHLTGVTVSGIPASVLAGRFSCAVPLKVGDNTLVVEALDAAGNRTSRTATLHVAGVPPTVTILAPVDGVEAKTEVVRVRATVSATSPIQQVSVGTGNATLENGVWEADYGLALGENVIGVVATLANGLTGSASVRVRHRDVAQEPLAVTGVDPAFGASAIEPSTLVSVSFNKPIDRASLAGRFTLSVNGQPLPGGYYIAPGEQTASFVARAPFPEGARVAVRIRGVEAQAGPDMSGTFASEFTVRPRLRQVRGHVLDEHLQAIPGVQVSIEGSPYSTRSGPDGGWHLVGVPAGAVTVRYDAGVLEDGSALPTVKRRLFVSGSEDTEDDHLLVVATDKGSVDFFDAGRAVHATFAGRQGALALDVPAGGFFFEDGKTSGFVSATQIPAITLPVPIESGRDRVAGLWQLQPGEIRFTEPVSFTFPNLTGLPAGRYAFVMTYDPARRMLERAGIARVADDAKSIATLEPLPVQALDFFGYALVDDAQQAFLAAKLNPAQAPAAPDTTAPDPEGQTGFLFDRSPGAPPMWLQALTLPLGNRPAAALGIGMIKFGPLPAPEVGMASIRGRIRTAQERLFSIESTGESGEITVELPCPARKFTFTAQIDEDGSAYPITISMRASRGATVISPPDGEEWAGKTGAGTARVEGTVELQPGTTLITAEAQSLRDSRTARLEAVLTEQPVVLDPVTQKPKRTGTLRIRRLVEYDASASGESDGITFFAGWPVEVQSGTRVKSESGPDGGFHVPVFSTGSDQGAVVCTEVETGLRWIVNADASDAEHPKLVRYAVTDGYPVCQTIWGISPGSSSPVSLTVDMRLLVGSVNFFNRDDRPVGGVCDASAKTEWDRETHELTSISMEDVGKTEVYFFREDDLETPIARYAMVTPPETSAFTGSCASSAHGEYKKLRFGPSERWTRRDRDACEQEKSRLAPGAEPSDEYKLRCEGAERILGLRLSEGDHLVVVAVNHATGYTGATTVVVPPISTKAGLDANGRCAADEEAGGPITFLDFGQEVRVSRCAQQDIRIQGNLRLYPPEIDVRVSRQVAPEGASTEPDVHLVRHGGAGTVRDDLLYVDTHWRIRLPPEDLDGDGTLNLTDRCDDEVGPPSHFGCPDPTNPSWQPSEREEPTPTKPEPLKTSGIPTTGGLGWPYAKYPKVPGPAADPFDLDADGVADSGDLCPYLSGDGGFRGCPAQTDTDRDGTYNESEGSPDCIYSPGPASTAGCPDPSQPNWSPPADAGAKDDTDQDGISNAEDLCPAVPGPADPAQGLKGCPSLASRFDTDEDGVPDGEDECLWQRGYEPGVHGCPPKPDPITGAIPPPPELPEKPPAIPGAPGKMLERFCSELRSPTPEQLQICARMETRLMDVPKGVPPLAGQLVRVTGSAVEQPAVAVFPILPGRVIADVQPALRVHVNGKDVSTNLDRANYYVHVVGNLTLFNDDDLDGRIDPATEIAVNPPAFQEPSDPPSDWKPGMPAFAVPLKAVYRSYEPDGTVVERFDRDREQEFRVLDLTRKSVVASTGNGGTRRVDEPQNGDPAGAALEGDLSYKLLLELLAPSDDGRAGVLGDTPTYQVRLGSDDYGIDCKVEQASSALTATCDGAWLYDVLSARDLVYIGVSLRGNAENILYKYNLAGLSPRTDLVTAGHAATAAKSIVADTGDTPATLRAISQPALANFFVSPQELRSGTVRLRADGRDVRTFDILWHAAGEYYSVSPAPEGESPRIEQVPRAGIDGSTLFRLPIPHQFVHMPGTGTEAGAQIEIALANTAASAGEEKTIALGKPQGTFQGANARAPGQAGAGGVNVADGHLSFRHEDFALPEFAGGVRFARTYSNADNEIGTLGIGWRHTFESYVVEERPGRYSVVIEGQSYDFPDCTATTSGTEGWECKSDNSHGGVLTVRELPEDDANAPKHIPDVLFETSSGFRYRFDRYSQQALQIASAADRYAVANQVQELAEYQVKVGTSDVIKTELPVKMIRTAGRRRWVLTAMEDGHAEPRDAHSRDAGRGWTVVQYFADSDMIRRIYRKGGKLELDFEYEAVSFESTDLSPRFRAAAVAQNFGFLKRVEAKFQVPGSDGEPSLDNPNAIVRLDFFRDEPGGKNRGNLTRVERRAGEGMMKDTAAVDQKWAYEYANPDALAPAGQALRGLDRWDATNELEKATLSVNGAEQWKSVWNRTLKASSFPHVKAFEVVDRMQLAGTSTITTVRTGADGFGWPEATPAWTVVEWTSSTHRKLTRADGVVVELDLNAYGNVTVESIAGATLKTSWFSDQEGGKVQPSSRTSPTARNLKFDSTDRMRPKVTTFGAAGADTHAVAGLGAGDQISRNEYDTSGPGERFGVPESSVRATRAGEATTETPIDARGDLTKLTVREPGTSGEPLMDVSLGAGAYDEEGVLREIEDDGAGRHVAHGDRDAWGLYKTTTTTLSNVAPGGRATVISTQERDWFGRVRLQTDDAGRSTEWKYDAAGRVEWRRIAGTPEQTFRWTYATGAGRLAVTETLDGTPHNRVTRYVDGLLVEESWTYGDDQKAERTYSYVGGRLSRSVDERGVVREYHYDAQGRLEFTTATAPATEQAREEVRYVRDAEGKVTSETDQNGLVTRTEYDQLGRAVYWNRGSAGGGKLDEEKLVLDPAGAVTQRKHGSYTWFTDTDALGRVRATRATDQSQVHTTTEYDKLGRKTHQTDHVLGLEEFWEYGDVLGRVTKYRRIVAPYSAPYEETSAYLDTPIEHRVDVTQTVAGSTVKRLTQWLDASGRALHTLEYVPGPGGTTLESHRYTTFDARGNALTTREPVGDGPAEAVTTRAYDAAGDLLSVTDPGGAKTSYTLHADGLVWKQDGPHGDEHWEFAYDAFGQLTRKALSGPPASETDDDVKGWSGGVWEYRYGAGATFSGQAGACAAYGPNPTAVEVDPLGYETARWYNAAQKLLCEVRSDTGRDRSSTNRNEIELAYDGPWLAKQVVREGSATTTLERKSYDHRGRVLLETESFAGPQSVSYAYTVASDWRGRAAEVSVSGTGGARAGRRELDALGNLVSQTWGGITDRSVYDAAGRLLAEQPAGGPERSYSYADGYVRSTTLVSMGGGSNETTSFEYWASGKQRTEAGPDGRSRRLVWNARGLLEREEYGRDEEFDVQQYTYDGGGNLLTRSHGGVTWAYAHGPRGELYRVTQPAGSGGDFNYQYDARGALVGIVPPPGGSGAQTFAYDYLGRQVGRTRGTSQWTTSWADGSSTTTEPSDPQHPGQRVLEQVLDGRGRTAVQRFSGVPTELSAVATTYDTEDQPLVVQETRGEATAEVVFGYDGRGLLTSITRGTEKVEYGRRTSGAVSSVTSPAGTVTYGYDGLERLEKTQSGTGPVTTLTWEAGGARLLEASDPERLRQCWRYDARGRISRMSNVLPGDDCDDEIRTQPLAEFRYGYDERGNRLWEDYRDANTSTLERTAYGYDAADRLTGVQYPSGAAELYRLGGEGSRMGQKNPAAFAGSLGPAGYASASGPEQEYRYDAQGGLTGITDGAGGYLATYEVDASGRVRVEARGGDRSEYTWDAGGRLVAATVLKAGTSKTLRYEYDYAGRRIRKTGPSGETRFLWGAGELVEEIGPTGTRMQYERGAGMALAVTSVDANGKPVGRERLMHDALGSVVGRVGVSGEPVLYRFDAWGAFRTPAQPEGTEPSLAYAGQHWDADVGLSYAQQRWYAPGTGRFLSEDPVFGDVMRPNSLHEFGYASGNPLIYFDPTGERPLSPEVKAAWDAAEKAGFDEKSVNDLLDAQERDRQALGIGGLTTEAMLDFAMVRMQVSHNQWNRGNYGIAVFQGVFGVTNSFAAGSITGDTNGKTLRNTGIAIGVGAVLKRVLGWFRGLGYGPKSVPLPDPAPLPMPEQVPAPAPKPPGPATPSKPPAQVAPADTAAPAPLTDPLILGEAGEAHSVASGIRLGKQLASEAQVADLISGGGAPLAGAGARVPIRDVARLTNQYGGSASDWAKIRSWNYKAADGASFETHAYKNVRTGEVVELKTKFQ